MASKRPTDHLLPPTKKRGADRQITQDDPDSDGVSLCFRELRQRRQSFHTYSLDMPSFAEGLCT